MNYDSDKNLNMEYDDDEDNFYQSEYSKKLKNVNSQEKDNEENFFLFKKNKKNSNLNSTNKTSTLQENSHQEQKSNKKTIRLSELENSNLYFILNIDEASNKEDIKRAYRNLCLSKHPDKGGNSQEFQTINRAYQILSNDICRKLYDNFSYLAMSLIDQILNNSEECLENIIDPTIDINSLDLEAISEIIKINAKN